MRVRGRRGCAVAAEGPRWLRARLGPWRSQTAVHSTINIASRAGDPGEIELEARSVAWGRWRVEIGKWRRRLMTSGDDSMEMNKNMKMGAETELRWPYVSCCH